VVFTGPATSTPGAIAENINDIIVVRAQTDMAEAAHGIGPKKVYLLGYPSSRRTDIRLATENPHLGCDHRSGGGEFDIPQMIQSSRSTAT